MAFPFRIDLKLINLRINPGNWVLTIDAQYLYNEMHFELADSKQRLLLIQPCYRLRDNWIWVILSIGRL